MATAGEPAFAGDASRQSALHLPGDKAPKLSVKLLEPQPVPQEQQPKITLTLNARQAELVAEALHHGAKELAQYADGHGRDIDGTETHCDYLGDLEKGLLAFVDNPKERAGELRRETETGLPEKAEAKRYERLLRQTAALRYPSDERTPELEARIERTIQKKVGEFRQECEMRERAKAYETSLWQEVERRHPDLSPEKREHYRARIEELVRDHRAALARHHQPQPPARSQEQGRAIER